MNQYCLAHTLNWWNFIAILFVGFRYLFCFWNCMICLFVVLQKCELINCFAFYFFVLSCNQFLYLIVLLVHMQKVFGNYLTIICELWSYEKLMVLHEKLKSVKQGSYRKCWCFVFLCSCPTSFVKNPSSCVVIWNMSEYVCKIQISFFKLKNW